MPLSTIDHITGMLPRGFSMSVAVQHRDPYRLRLPPPEQSRQSRLFPYDGAIHIPDAWIYRASLGGKALVSVGRPDWAPLELALLSAHTIQARPSSGSGVIFDAHPRVNERLASAAWVAGRDARVQKWLSINDGVFEDLFDQVHHHRSAARRAHAIRAAELLDALALPSNEKARESALVAAGLLLGTMGFAISFRSAEIHLPGYIALVLPGVPTTTQVNA